MITLVKEVMDDFEGIAKRKDIKIKGVKLDEAYYVMADAFFLKQVFENLLSNAIKFSPHGKLVELIAEEVDEFYHIIVKDQGPGISKKDKSKLFTKYQTLSAKPTGDESSTGLGLSIVKKYVEEMEGSVWVESDEGKGAEFYVSFKQAK
jgi:signal transduction histidine kinase